MNGNTISQIDLLETTDRSSVHLEVIRGDLCLAVYVCQCADDHSDDDHNPQLVIFLEQNCDANVLFKHLPGQRSFR